MSQIFEGIIMAIDVRPVDGQSIHTPENPSTNNIVRIGGHLASELLDKQRVIRIFLHAGIVVSGTIQYLHSQYCADERVYLESANMRVLEIDSPNQHILTMIYVAGETTSFDYRLLLGPYHVSKIVVQDQYRQKS